MSDDKRLEGVLPLTTTTFHVLVSLANGPRHGYGVAQEVEEMTDGHIVMGPGTLYGTLKRMLDSELIRESDNPGEDGVHVERRRYYEITPLGSEALRLDSERLLRSASLAQERLSG